MGLQLGGGTLPISATGQIAVASFVKFDPSTPNCVIQATGPQDRIVAISQQGSWAAPGVVGTNTSYCTPPGPTPPAPSSSTPWQINCFGEGCIVRLQLSPSCGAVNPGDFL